MNMQKLTVLIQFAAFNILPLIGVLFLGWDWRAVIIYYWLETITICLVTFLSIKPVSMQNARVKGLDVATLIWLVPSYGILVLLIAGGFNPEGFKGSFDLLVGMVPFWVAITVVMSILAYRRRPMKDIDQLMKITRTIMRVAILHGVLLIGVVFFIVFDLPAAAAVVLITVHALADIKSWRMLRAHPVVLK